MMENISQHLVVLKTKVKACLYVFICTPCVGTGSEDLPASWVLWPSLCTVPQRAAETDREGKLVLCI